LLVIATKNGCTPLVDVLLKNYKADPSVSNQTCIVVACYDGNYYLVDRLLDDPRTDPAYNNQMPLSLAISKGRYDVIKRLLEDPKVFPTFKILASAYTQFMTDKKIVDGLERNLYKSRYLPSMILFIFFKIYDLIIHVHFFVSVIFINKNKN